jgi:methyl-accepting chemotaxis protein
MNKIKIVALVILIISLLLAFISIDIAHKNRTDIGKLNSYAGQKTLIEEISKAIFYSYKNGKLEPKVIKDLKKINSTSFNQKEFNDFIHDVEMFIKQQRVTTTYNSIITAKLVNHIYHKNVLLIRALNRQIQTQQRQIHTEINYYKKLQSGLFFILIILLFYLFTQLHFLIDFIQEFSKTSKKIINNKSIKGISPIRVNRSSSAINEATKSYNHMVEKMNLSIDKSIQNMEKSIQSLEEVALNIEIFLELLSTMNPKESDDFFKKEDAVIDSLDTLIHLQKRVKNLKEELKKLI